MRSLDLDLLLEVADIAVGGQALVRDAGLLEAALARPFAAVAGSATYPDVSTKLAALLHSLVCNHALVDGNKRLGWLATYTTYRINGWLLEAPDDEAYDLVIAVAEGRADVPEIALHLERWVQPDAR